MCLTALPNQQQHDQERSTNETKNTSGKYGELASSQAYTEMLHPTDAEGWHAEHGAGGATHIGSNRSHNSSNNIMLIKNQNSPSKKDKIDKINTSMEEEFIPSLDPMMKPRKQILHETEIRANVVIAGIPHGDGNGPGDNHVIDSNKSGKLVQPESETGQHASSAKTSANNGMMSTNNNSHINYNGNTKYMIRLYDVGVSCPWHLLLGPAADHEMSLTEDLAHRLVSQNNALSSTPIKPIHMNTKKEHDKVLTSPYRNEEMISTSSGAYPLLTYSMYCTVCICVRVCHNCLHVRISRYGVYGFSIAILLDVYMSYIYCMTFISLFGLCIIKYYFKPY